MDSEAPTSQVVDVPVPAELSDVIVATPRTLKSHVANWARMRATEPALTNKDIAERLGIAPQTLNAAIYRGRKAGWLRFEDPIHEVKFGMIPKVVENVNLFLDARDKQVTIEAAKATIWKQFQASEGIADAPTTILALKIQMPEGYNASELPQPKGRIVGKPNTFAEGEVIAVTAIPHDPTK